MTGEMAGKRPAIDWAALPYGRLSDEEIARRLGVTRQAVGIRRRKHSQAAAGRPLPLTRLELEDLEALERGLALLLEEARPHLAITTSHAVDRTPGWRSEARRALRRGQRDGRALAFRFRAPGRRLWTAWLAPLEARTWLFRIGWADAASARIEELQRAATGGAEA
jgi:hypothetical protein